MILPVPTDKEASNTPPAPIWTEAGTTREEPSDSKRTGTPKSDQPATPGSQSSGFDDNDTEDEKSTCCFLGWLGIDTDCKRILDDKVKILAHHKRRMGNTAIYIVQ